MKTKNLLRQMVHMCIIVVVTISMSFSCVEPEPDFPVNPNTEQVGEVEFDLDLGFGGGENPGGSEDPGNIGNTGNSDQEIGSASNPVNVESGDTLSVTVTQTSSYKDPDGTIYSVEPKASIELFAKIDTIYAKDVETLISINGKPNVKTTTTGSNPVCHNTVQTFMIGNQEVEFDLMHEIYTYVNSAAQAIEMPYIKVNQANFGTANATDGKKSNTSSPITLKRVSLTRASIVESNTFEVNVNFNLDLEAVNTKTPATKNVSFNVKYVAVVEDVTELDGMLEYVVEGSASELSENNFVTPKVPFLMELKQKSYFASSDTTVGVCNPIARFSMHALCDTVFVTELDLLSLFVADDPITSVEGENPIKNTSKYVFNAGGGQSFEIETMYEVFAYDDSEELPYLMFGTPTKKSVNVTAVNQTRATVGDTAFYKVVTEFSVPVKSVNAKNAIDKTLNFTVEHVGCVVSQIELEGMLEYVVEGSTNELSENNYVTPKVPFLVELKQKSYLSSSKTTFGTCNPIAKFSMHALCDTVFVTELDSLSLFVADEPITSVEGENPIKNASKYVFNAGGGQSFEIESMYEVFAYNGEELPYLMFGEPTKKSVSVTPITQTRAVVRDTAFYKVVTEFSVPVKSVNAKNAIDKTLNFTVEHVGGVVTTTDVVELIDITYRKDVLFYEASYNLPDRTAKVVYRDRNYSDGTVLTDTIYSGTSEFAPASIHVAEIGTSERINFSDNHYAFVVDKDTFHLHLDRSETNIDRVYQSTVKHSMKLDKIDMNTFGYLASSSNKGDIYDYSLYKNAISRELFDESAPEDGWYFQYITNDYHKNFYPNDIPVFMSVVRVSFYAYFLYIDDKIIDFIEYAPKLEKIKENAVFCEENETRGEALVFKTGLKGTFLDRDINIMTVDTFYVAKGDTIINH